MAKATKWILRVSCPKRNGSTLASYVMVAKAFRLSSRCNWDCFASEVFVTSCCVSGGPGSVEVGKESAACCPAGTTASPDSELLARLARRGDVDSSSSDRSPCRLFLPDCDAMSSSSSTSAALGDALTDDRWDSLELARDRGAAAVFSGSSFGGLSTWIVGGKNIAKSSRSRNGLSVHIISVGFPTLHASWLDKILTWRRVIREIPIPPLPRPIVSPLPAFPLTLFVQPHSFQRRRSAGPGFQYHPAGHERKRFTQSSLLFLMSGRIAIVGIFVSSSFARMLLRAEHVDVHGLRPFHRRDIPSFLPTGESPVGT